MLPARILLVEDDENLGFAIEDNLNDRNFEVTRATDGDSGYETFLSHEFELCILDVMMPKTDGFTLGRKIRKQKPEIPIFFLTAKNKDRDKLEGLKIGAEDYITKPFNIDELALRITNLLKTLNRVKSREDQHIFKIGTLEFNSKENRLNSPEESIHLTKKQSELLKLLCSEKENVVTREVALRVVWGKNDYFMGRSMDVFITKLRKFLSADPHARIETIHGTGFKLTTADELSKTN